MEWSEFSLYVMFAIVLFGFGYVAANFLPMFMTDSDGPLFSPGSVSLSPSDHIAGRDILVYDDRVVIPLAGVRVTNYADTGSMRPVLDSSANGIVITPNSPDEISVGDIVSYWKEDQIIVHRVIAKDGETFTVRGDNALDSEQISFDEIDGLLIGVIY